MMSTHTLPWVGSAMASWVKAVRKSFPTWLSVREKTSANAVGASEAAATARANVRCMLMTGPELTLRGEKGEEQRKRTTVFVKNLLLCFYLPRAAGTPLPPSDPANSVLQSLSASCFKISNIDRDCYANAAEKPGSCKDYSAMFCA